MNNGEVTPGERDRIWTGLITLLGFPRWLSSKESTCNAEDYDLIPGSGRSPGGVHGNPLQYSCLENSMDRGAWWATVHRVTESYTTESTEHSTHTWHLEHNIMNICWDACLTTRLSTGPSSDCSEHVPQYLTMPADWMNGWRRSCIFNVVESLGNHPKEEIALCRDVYCSIICSGEKLEILK